MFGMTKQSSFQLMDAVTNCWPSTVDCLVTKSIFFSIYSGTVNTIYQTTFVYIPISDSITGGGHVKFYS